MEDLAVLERWRGYSLCMSVLEDILIELRTYSRLQYDSKMAAKVLLLVRTVGLLGSADFSPRNDGLALYCSSETAPIIVTSTNLLKIHQFLRAITTDPLLVLRLRPLVSAAPSEPS